MRGKTGIYRVPEGVYELTCGDVLLASDAAQVWSLTTAKEAQWVERLRAHSHALFGDVAAVRVGIKTTADSVFIRSDWDSLPTTLRPEPELLRPLLRHGDARRWSLSRGMEPAACVLYPHEVYDGRRRAIPLSRYPKARAYLESHRAPLERRHYVTEAGRRWYEIWVPQDPAAWVLPKIVFPDISPGPRFFLDTDGRLVDGDCYWITLRPHVPPEMIYLLLGVANSRVMSRYHDLVFNNRLYSARRRYITQYVAKYPLPSPVAPASRALIKLVRRITDDCMLGHAGAGADTVEEKVDALVAEAFGLPPGEATG
jgi:hypothetical protein